MFTGKLVNNDNEEKLDQKQTVNFKELLMSEVVQPVAVINVLDRKGIVSKAALLEEMKRVQAAMLKSKA